MNSNLNTASFYGYGGVSDSLAGIFEALADQEGLNGPRYRQVDIWALLKDVAERRFASGIYELCHLLRGFGILDRRGEAVNLFWMADPATPAGFRSVLSAHENSKRLSDGFFIEGNVLNFRYSDNKDFEVKTGRMPYLAALFDFMVNAIGFVEIQDDLAMLSKSDLTHRELSDISNGLFSKCYAFLSDHLPSSQGQKKMRHILTFLNGYLGEGFDLAEINDETIMAFWEDQDLSRGSDASDFIRFTTVFDDFTRYAQAIRETLSKRDVSDAKVFGTEAHEANLDRIGGEGLSVAEEGNTILELLQEEPLDQVKFIGKKDLDHLADILDRTEEISRWALSYLRSLTFGQGQARISQGLRNKLNADRFQALCEDSSKTNYEDQLTIGQKLSDGLRNTQLASLYVVNNIGAKENSDKTIELDFELLGKARKAFHNINRQGFQDSVLDDPTMADLFEQGADCLDLINRKYDRVLKAIQQVDASVCYDEDKPRFATRFYRIYGGHA
ncbi:hypothetical protein [Curvivirga aplysinae]|uniref:hypothetical protein n=1 Tax=Curvivirga aplysinae TaxID=2529852 RepID=UPI0012BD0FFE|nr:hypothetical protein [Curvivirga aplysinae]MTI08729.1 hypothetical protein [Curvivirga aplysinae]